LEGKFSKVSFVGEILLRVDFSEFSLCRLNLKCGNVPREISTGVGIVWRVLQCKGNFPREKFFIGKFSKGTIFNWGWGESLVKNFHGGWEYLT